MVFKTKILYFSFDVKAYFFSKEKDIRKIIMLINLIVISFFIVLIVLLPFIFCFYNFYYRKISRLEAGFMQTSKLQMRFSIQFVFLLLIFILFDTEILFTFGFLLNSFEFILLNSFILIFLFVTLLVEWKFNKLIWLN